MIPYHFDSDFPDGFPDNASEELRYSEEMADHKVDPSKWADVDYKNTYTFCSLFNYGRYFDYDSRPDSYYKNVVRRNCMWGGCSAECAKKHDEGVEGYYRSVDEAIKVVVNPNLVYNPFYVEDVQPYTPDYDHCYYQPAEKIPISSTQISSKTQPLSDTEDKLDVLKNIPTPPSTSESPSESSSDDEVDVVTVPEEYRQPAAPRFEAPRRSTRASRSVKKPLRTHSVSAKSLKAAMKRTRMQQQSVSVTRRPYRRRKVNNSIELTPFSSVPSSAHSSRCSSDAEDVDKRKTHNSSERKRREAQRTALQNLRVCIPDLQNNPKAPKVLILNSATTLVKKLTHNDKTLSDLKSREIQRKSDLTAKLNQLRMRMKMSHTRLQ